MPVLKFPPDPVTAPQPTLIEVRLRAAAIVMESTKNNVYSSGDAILQMAEKIAQYAWAGIVPKENDV